MPEKKKRLGESKKNVAKRNNQTDIDGYEETSGKKLNVTRAPAIEVQEELEQGWKADEDERSRGESDEFTEEGMGIEEKEEEGEESYSEIEKAISDEADEEEEQEADDEEKENERQSLESH